MSQSVRETVDHPLDPLSADEFSSVATILRRDRAVGDSWRIASIEMLEPGKADLRRYDAGGPTPPRRAVVVCLERANRNPSLDVVASPPAQCHISATSAHH
jgi:primary-amine oxidase